MLIFNLIIVMCVRYSPVRGEMVIRTYIYACYKPLASHGMETGLKLKDIDMPRFIVYASKLCIPKVLYAWVICQDAVDDDWVSWCVKVYIEVDRSGEEFARNPEKSVPLFLASMTELFLNLEASIGNLSTFYQVIYCIFPEIMLLTHIFQFLASNPAAAVATSVVFSS